MTQSPFTSSGLLIEDLMPQSDRGKPIPPKVQVQMTLNHFGGGHFQRTTGMCGGASQYGARYAIVTFQFSSGHFPRIEIFPAEHH